MIGKCSKCKNPIEVPLTNGMCRWHFNKEKVKTPIKKLSDKKQIENKVYLGKRIIFLSENPLCQANLKECTGKSSEVHHKKGRIGGNFLNTATWLAVCRKCHTWVELNPIKAKELNLSESRN